MSEKDASEQERLTNTVAHGEEDQPERAIDTAASPDPLAVTQDEAAATDAPVDAPAEGAVSEETIPETREPDDALVVDGAAEAVGHHKVANGAAPDQIAEDHGRSGEGAACGTAEDAPVIPASSDGAADWPSRASAELKAIVEALIFASPEPLGLKALTKLLDTEPKEDIATALAGLKEDYERSSGLQLVEVAGGYQIVTRHDLHDWVRRLFHERSTQKLSAQALETLAVVAYRQPITAVEITEIRGVNTSGVLNTLLERHLIKIVGRKAVVGRPFMYATTKEFLIRFGLNDLADLPRVEDMVDALGLDGPLLVEQVLVEDLLPLEEPDPESSDTASEEIEEPDVPEEGGRGGSGH